MVHHTASISRLMLIALGSIAFAATVSENSQACDTPVYRYAMYRWTPTPYEVYYFHEDFWQEQKYNEKDTNLHKAIERLAIDKELPANVVLIPVNVFADKELRSVPPDVRKMWAKQENKKLPTYMLVSPQGAHVYSGDLNSEEVLSLATSPTRERIADLLADGRSGTFVLLTGTDQAANDSAEKVLNELGADVASGKIELYKAPQAGFGSPTVASPEGKESPSPQEPSQENKASVDKNAPKQGIGVVRLERDDPKERWLVEMLLGVEPDLKDKEFDDQPMIFVVYGRARALPPYIGKGITRDNMLEVLDFITSACSCTVKEQNPGVDLLTRYDWETAAEKLADRFGTEEGNEGFYAPDEFFPELIVGAGNTKPQQPLDDAAQQDTTVASAASDNPEHSDTTNTGDGSKTPSVDETVNSKNDVDKLPDGTPSSDAKDPVEPSPTEVVDGSAGQNVGGSKVAALKSDKQTSPAASTSNEGETSASNSWMYTLGIGLGVGLFMLIGASFLLFRNR